MRILGTIFVFNWEWYFNIGSRITNLWVDLLGYILGGMCKSCKSEAADTE